MHSVQLNKKIKGIHDAYRIQSIVQCTAESYIDRDHNVLPRIGDDYQAEIPPLHLKNEEANHTGMCRDERDYLDSQSTLRDVKMSFDSMLPHHLRAILNQDERLSFPIPEALDEHWSDVETASFLMGLYMFGKDFVLLRKIVESKTISCMQSFYYGKFYRSNEQSKWSKLWKLRSRECLLGEKIFNRCKRQALVSRLCSHVSKECRNNLVEVSRRFEDGHISFEEYIFGLKDVVGISLLIEAVGIGKGKQDLTSTTLGQIKANNISTVHPEIPVGQACSYLSSTEVIKFLTGGYRLSKTKASDLFWEAVWPRLLARGWNSEQPKDSIFPSQNLVFLLPGIEKFTNKLVRGKEYFDSVSDVLNKVASEPGLLELEVEEDKGNENSQSINQGLPFKQDEDDVSNKQVNSHLQPCFLACSKEPVKFAVVDTTSDHGVGQHEISMPESLPAEMSPGLISLSVSCKSNDSYGKSKDEAKGTSVSSPAELADDRVTVIVNDNVHNTSDPNWSVDEDYRTRSASVVSNKQPAGDINYKSREKAKSEKRNNLASMNLVLEDIDARKSKLGDLTKCRPHDCGANKEAKAKIVLNDDTVKVSEQQATLNNWRHSTRNRLMTVKAMEAIEYGFLEPKGKRKGEGGYTSRSISKGCRQVRRRTGSQAWSDIGTPKDRVNKKDMHEVPGSESYMAGKHQN